MIVTTGTASGKTLAFNLPVLDALATRAEEPRALPLSDEGARAGSGARARRARAYRGVRAAIYDGDTPQERRWQIRRWANLVLTNPDMLHIGVLPRHDLLGGRAAQPPLRRRRRGARLPRRVRLARRERAAPAAPPRARLRRGAAVPARVGNDREPGRARALAARRRRDRDRRRRRRRAPSGRSHCGTRSCSTPSSACARARSATRRG